MQRWPPGQEHNAPGAMLPQTRHPVVDLPGHPRVIHTVHQVLIQDQRVAAPAPPAIQHVHQQYPQMAHQHQQAGAPVAAPAIMLQRDVFAQVMERLHEQIGQRFQHTEAVLVQVHDQTTRRLDQLEQAMKSMLERTAERFERTETTFNEIVDKLAGVRAQAEADVQHVATCVEQTHAVQMKATQSVFIRIQKLDEFIGASAASSMSSKDPDTILRRLQSIEFGVHDLLEKHLDPEASQSVLPREDGLTMGTLSLPPRDLVDEGVDPHVSQVERTFVENGVDALSTAPEHARVYANAEVNTSMWDPIREPFVSSRELGLRPAIFDSLRSISSLDSDGTNFSFAGLPAAVPDADSSNVPRPNTSLAGPSSAPRDVLWGGDTTAGRIPDVFITPQQSEYESEPDPAADLHLFGTSTEDMPEHTSVTPSGVDSVLTVAPPASIVVPPASLRAADRTIDLSARKSKALPKLSAPVLRISADKSVMKEKGGAKANGAESAKKAAKTTKKAAQPAKKAAEIAKKATEAKNAQASQGPSAPGGAGASSAPAQTATARSSPDYPLSKAPNPSPQRASVFARLNAYSDSKPDTPKRACSSSMSSLSSLSSITDSPASKPGGSAGVSASVTSGTGAKECDGAPKAVSMPPKTVKRVKDHDKAVSVPPTKAKRSDKGEEKPRKRRKTEGVPTDAKADAAPKRKTKTKLGARGHGQKSNRDGRRRATVERAQVSALGPESEDEVLDEIVLRCKWPARVAGERRTEFVQCDNCDAWYHTGCVGLSPDDDRLTTDKVFICPPCESCDGARERQHGVDSKPSCGRPDCDQKLQDSGDFFVERIIGRGPRDISLGHPGGSFLWLVKWDGYPARDSTWEPLDPETSETAKFIVEFDDAANIEGRSLAEPNAIVLLNEARAAGFPKPVV